MHMIKYVIVVMNIVGIVHFSLYLFMFIGLFSFNMYIVWCHIIVSCALLVHWATNDNKCILTEVECYVRDVHEELTLTRELLSPLLEQSEVSVVIGTMVGLVVSIFKLYLIGMSPDATIQ